MTKISQLSDIGGSLAAGDEFVIRDISDISTPNKKVTASGFIDYVIAQGVGSGFTQIAAGVGPLARALASSSGATGTLTFSTAAATTLLERARIDSSGSILANTTTNPTTGGVARPVVSLKQINDSSLFSGIHVEANADQSILGIGYNGSAFGFITSYRTTGAYKDIAFSLGGSEKLRITTTGQLRLAGAGITFNGDTATANELDDYEEGVWTPVVSFGGASVDITGTFSGTYTKVGNVVTVMFILSFTSKGSSVGTMAVSGMPFNAGGALNVITGFGYIHRLAALQTAGQLHLHLVGTTFNPAFAGYNGGNTVALTNTDIANTTDLRGGIVFRV